MISKLRVHIVGDNERYQKALLVSSLTLCSLKRCNLVIFTGGEDINPDMYGETRHKTTYSNPDRDIREELVFKKALDSGIPMLGICRGAQLLNVLNGGKLIQHVNNHRNGDHIMKTENTTYKVNSTHHQMMYPYNMHPRTYDILGYSRYVSDEYWKNARTQYDMRGLVEPEIVYFPYTHCLAVQFHPETLPNTNRAKKYVTDLVKSVLLS